MSDLMQLLERVTVGSAHPECQPGEMFVCYEHRSKTDDMKLPGKRLGTVVIDANGNDVSERAKNEDIVPVFANREQNMARYHQPA